MKERGIIFTAGSIPRIQDGSKTQTRRVIVPQPELRDYRGDDGVVFDWGFLHYASSRSPCPDLIERSRLPLHSPYGVPGDMVYAKEALVRLPKTGDNAGAFYAVDHEPVLVGREPMAWRWKRPFLTARFMPKEAARIRRDLTDVRVARAQDISEEDAKAEGCDPIPIPIVDEGTGDHLGDQPSYRYAFHQLWDSINAKRGYGWDVNLWVWALTFRREES